MRSLLRFPTYISLMDGAKQKRTVNPSPLLLLIRTLPAFGSVLSVNETTRVSNRRLRQDEPFLVTPQNRTILNALQDSYPYR